MKAPVSLTHSQKHPCSTTCTVIALSPCAGRMVLAGAGDVDHEELVAAARSAFASLPADSTSAEELVAADPSHFTGSAVAVRDPDSPVTTLAIAFQGSDWLSPDSVTLQARPHTPHHPSIPHKSNPQTCLRR